MKFTDKNAIKMLKKLNVFDVEDDIDFYPEDERDGRSDMQMLADEAGYVLSCYEEDGHAYHDALEEAREKLYETQYGKVIPLDVRTLKPKHGYWEYDIQNAKDYVNGYRRLQRLVEKLKKMGYYSKWV